MQFDGSAALDAALLASATGTGGILNGAKVGLTKALVDFDPNQPPGQVGTNECDYAGYARAAVTWNAPSISDDGQLEIVGTVPEFRPTDATVDNNAYQAFLVDSAGAKYLGSGQLDGNPIPMGTTLDALVVTMRFSVGSGGSVVSVS